MILCPDEMGMVDASLKELLSKIEIFQDLKPRELDIW
jgi:hypothetical protein